MKHQAFKVVGFKVRTTNENNQAMQDIGNVWQKVMAGGLLDKVPHRSEPNLIGLYYEYEKDHTKPYSFLLGVPVSSFADIPAGMVGVEIPEQNYTLFPVEGPMPDRLIATWQKIWQTASNRTFTFDFERYDHESFGENPKLDVWISTMK